MWLVEYSGADCTFAVLLIRYVTSTSVCAVSEHQSAVYVNKRDVTTVTSERCTISNIVFCSMEYAFTCDVCVLRLFSPKVFFSF